MSTLLFHNKLQFLIRWTLRIKVVLKKTIDKVISKLGSKILLIILNVAFFTKNKVF